MASTSAHAKPSIRLDLVSDSSDEERYHSPRRDDNRTLPSSPSQTTDVAAARTKMEELFLQWISMGGTRELIRGMIGDLKENKSIEIPTLSLSSSRSSLVSPRSGGSSSARHGHAVKTPPISPGKGGKGKHFTPEEGSPDHFSFEDKAEQAPIAEGVAEKWPTSSVSTPAKTTHSPSHTSSTPPTPRAHAPTIRSAANEMSTSQKQPAKTERIPQFFYPGEGGRGRGRPMLGEALEDKLPLILQIWRRNLHEDDSASNGSEEAPENVPGGNELIDIVGVRIPKKDAMASLPVEQFAAVAKTLCGFPSFFAAPLFRRVRHQFGSRHLRKDGTSNNPLSKEIDEATRAGVNAWNSPIPNLGDHIEESDDSEKKDDQEHEEKTSAANLPPNQPSQWAKRPPSAADKAFDVKENKNKLIPEDEPTKTEEDDRDTSGKIQLCTFLHYWRMEMEPFDYYDRFFRLISQRGAAPRNNGKRGIVAADFMPFLEELLAFHPGLAFLERTPEFQEKYARTVIARIFYMLDHYARQVINCRSLRRSNLLQAFHTVDMEDDINVVNDYFSYEHFYVLYCKFWELDSDHDFLLTREDLNRMTDLTQTVLDRVFEEAGRPFTSGQRGKMGYEDFICFLISEEDKTSEAALRYWFNVVDINADGVITPDEMRHFYREQHARMVELGLEAVSFEDLLIQMNDLLSPGRCVSVVGSICFDT
eukprot:gb/GECG01005859.1/.p1 GENE.gb/GECG01005859.1/~~gb/GECG01005859.1/.p1  ORF type:complete len:704 (+),score=87.88 gb/GECG01005859.1/:1-2112(+)